MFSINVKKIQIITQSLTSLASAIIIMHCWSKKQQSITTNLIHNKSVLGLGQYYTGWMVVTIIIIIFLFLLGGSGLLGQLCGWWGCVTTGGGRVGWGRLHGHNLTHLSTQTPVIVLDIFQTVVMSLWWRKLFTHHAQDRQAQDEVNKIMLGNFISSLAFSAWSQQCIVISSMLRQNRSGEQLWICASLGPNSHWLYLNGICRISAIL